MENLEFLDLPEQLMPEERLYTLIDSSIALPSRYVTTDIRKGPGASDSLFDDLMLSLSGGNDIQRTIDANQKLAQNFQAYELHDDSVQLPKAVVRYIGARLKDDIGRPVQTGVVYDNLQQERYRYVLIPGSFKETLSGNTDTAQSSGAVEVRFKKDDAAQQEKIITTVVDHPVYPARGERDSYYSSIILDETAEMITPLAESVLEQAIDSAKAELEAERAVRSSSLARRIGQTLGFHSPA
jgi:hypothetical protein